MTSMLLMKDNAMQCSGVAGPGNWPWGLYVKNLLGEGVNVKNIYLKFQNLWGILKNFKSFLGMGGGFPSTIIHGSASDVVHNRLWTRSRTTNMY